MSALSGRLEAGLRRKPEATQQWAVSQRNLLLLAGAAVTGYGLWRRDWPGGLAALGGGLLLSGAAAAGAVRGSCAVSQTVNRPAAEIYQFWRETGNWSRFMPGVQRARETGARQVAWVRLEAGRDKEGCSEILEEIPGRYLRWRSWGAGTPYEARLEMRPAPGDRGTELRLLLGWQSVRGLLPRLLQAGRGRGFEQQARETLRYSKQLLEAGEIPTTAGQPHGARGTKGEMERRLWRETTREEETGARGGADQQLAAS